MKLHNFTHYIDDDNNYCIQQDGKDVLIIKLDKENKAIEISTDKEVWAGPINLLKLTQDIN